MEKSIWKVEDEALIAMPIKTDLEKFGYNVLIEHSGEKAVETFRNNNEIDLILMDIELGQGIDGAEASNLILKEKSIPIVFLSNHSDAETVNKIEKISSYGYVLKSSGITILDASIKMALKLFAANQRMNEEIEERKRMEKILIESKEKYRLLYDSITDSVYILDRELHFTMVNNNLEKLVRIPRKELLGNKVQDIFPWIESTDFFKTYKKVIETGKEDTVIDEFAYEDGRNGWYEVRIYPVQEGIFCIARDITELIQTEKMLKKALQEKENLLRELQHRAKNSFAMISSMINLAENNNLSNEGKSVLKEVSSRIRSVSEMYDLLYSTNSFTEVRLDEYLSRVSSSLPIISANITLKITCDAITTPVKTAIPVGLIIVELIINSIKHAFPGNRNGTINLLLKKTNTGAIIQVEDDGTGLPEAPDLSAVNSMGLNIVNALIRQIGGSYKIESGDGTRYIVDFPIE